MPQALDINDKAATGELKELKADIAALRSDFSKLIDDAGAVARVKADQVAERGRSAAGEAGNQLKAQKAKVEDQVRMNPLAAAGIAFGVGVVIAAMSRR